MADLVPAPAVTPAPAKEPPTSYVVTLRVSPAMRAALDAVAKEQGLTRAAVAERAIAAGLGRLDAKVMSEEIREGRRHAMAIKKELLEALFKALEEIQARDNAQINSK